MAMEKADFLKRLKTLFDTQKLAVLATSRDDGPYTSLVAFAAGDGAESLYFATTRSTRKFANLAKNPEVSLMIDNRSNAAADFREAVAVTVLGTATVVPEEEKSALTDLYLAKHPYLDEFVTAPSCALIRVAVRTYLMVSRFQDVSRLEMDR